MVTFDFEKNKENGVSALLIFLFLSAGVIFFTEPLITLAAEIVSEGHGWTIGADKVYNDSTGIKVGIGTATPSTPLDVRGVGNFSDTIYINNGTDISTFMNAFDNASIHDNLSDISTIFGNYYLFNGSWNALTYYVTALSELENDAGFITDWVDSSSVLNCTGTDVLLADGSCSALTTDTDTHMGYDNIAMTNETGETFDEIVHFAKNVSIADNLTVGGDVLYVDSSSGRVGIGTTSPTHKLNVVGEANFTENATFEEDVIIDGVLFGGSPVKIAGVNISNNIFSLTENLNASSRFTLQNTNSGSNATSVISAINDVGGSMSVGIGSSNFMLGDMDSSNITALFSRARGSMYFANFFKQVFVWLYNPSDDNDADNLVEIMRLNETGLSIVGNVTAENLFDPQIIFAHNNATMVLDSVNVWANVTFYQEDAEIKKGIGHTFNDATNHTFTINEDGFYDIDYDFDVIDTSVSASDIDVAGRVILSDGLEIEGSVFETDIIKQNIENELSHSLIAEFKKGDIIVFQFTADDVDVEISTHGTFGEHPESATIRIEKVANL